MAFADHLAADMAAITTGEFALAVNWDGSDVQAVRIDLVTRNEDRGRNGIHDELDLLVARADVPSLWYRQEVVVDGESWWVQSWSRENDAAWRVRLVRRNRPRI